MLPITLEGDPSKKKQRIDTKKDAKMIKSDNFTRSNREKSNIAIAILEKLTIGWHHNYFVFSPTVSLQIMVKIYSVFVLHFRS